MTVSCKDAAFTGIRVFCHGALFLASVLTCACAPSHHEQEAASDVRTLQGAVDSFRFEYGYDPVPTNTKREAHQAEILQVLCPSADSLSARSLNPKGIHFLNVPPDRVIDGAFVDPWGNPYHLAFDSDGDGITEVGSTHITSRVAIWSSGKNGRNDHGRNDDICSWCANP